MRTLIVIIATLSTGFFCFASVCLVREKDMHKVMKISLEIKIIICKILLFLMERISNASGVLIRGLNSVANKLLNAVEAEIKITEEKCK